jgi:hypothetical protein
MGRWNGCESSCEPCLVQGEPVARIGEQRTHDSPRDDEDPGAASKSMFAQTRGWRQGRALYPPIEQASEA